MTLKSLFLTLLLCLTSLSSIARQQYDLIIRNGKVFDAKTGQFSQKDVAIKGDQIMAVGEKLAGNTLHEIDASGLTVSPGE